MSMGNIISFRSILVALSFLTAICSIPAFALESNFPDRKAMILDACPYVELSDFSFGNRFGERGMRFEQKLSWKNVASQPIAAFEVVILKYDAFDDRVIGSRWTITGKDSADWRPLAPGETRSDGTFGYGSEEVFTAIAYVRSARLADGTIWRVNEAQLINDLRKVAPGIKDFGSTKPDPKQKSN